jgi:MFS-type transporter involved in bile tolerance (Atg22 family)
VVTLITGSVRAGLLSIIILFIGGGLMLYKVDFNKGEQIAKEFGA